MASELEDPWFVYVVECADGSLYTGVARDVEKRVGQHNEGKGAKYTRGRGPVHVLVESPALARGDALRLEAKAKRLKGDAKLGAVKDGKKSLEGPDAPSLERDLDPVPRQETASEARSEAKPSVAGGAARPRRNR